MPPSPRHLFVYGTLRPGLAGPQQERLIAGFVPTGPATVPGLLYDLGEFPGLVDGPGLVRGDLYEVDDESRLAALDAYEECGGGAALYERVVMAATLPDGHQLPVWVYRYCRPVRHAVLITSGDYARPTADE